MTKSHLPKTGLHANIMTNYQCSNGGISSRSDRVLIVDPYDHELTPEQEKIAVVIGQIIGTVHLHPLHGVPAGNVGYMAGGSYVATSDSRLSQEIQRVAGIQFYGALALHDRSETPAQYRALSI